ncbi:MAG: amidase [Maioricimonas sp. JB049]
MADFPESPFVTLPELGTALRNGRTTSRKLAEFYLNRCEQLGPKFNAVVSITRDRALEEADRADRELAGGNDRGPLHGIPYGVKDLLATAGAPTSWGAAPFKDQVFAKDATAVRKLADAGAVLIAKLSMVELAGGIGYDQANASFTGPGLNPWDPSRWSGGSSSGSGSAVAAGLVPFAIGSETWGSIVTPAAYCGVAGLRPTYGRISRHGAMALSWTMDKLGPMGRTAHDCGLVLAALVGADPEDETCRDDDWTYPVDDARQRRFRLAELKGTTERLQQEVADNYQAARDVVAGFADIEEAELPDWPYEEVAGTIISCEAATVFEELVRKGSIR